MRLRRWWGRLSRRDRRAVGLGALVLVPALLWTFALSPYLERLAERRDRLAAERRALLAERELLASEDRYPRAVEAGLGRLRELRPRLLDGRSEGMAAAGLAQLLEDWARASRVHLVRVEPGTVRGLESRLQAVPVALQGESDLQGLLEFLAALSGSEKILRVGSLQVSRRGAGPGGVGEGVEVLSFALSVVGLALEPEEGSGA